MNARNQLKVIRAGFIIIRSDDSPQPRIKFKGKGSHEWSTFEKFPTKSARDRKLIELLKSETFIQD